MSGKSNPWSRTTSGNPISNLQPPLFAVGCTKLPAMQPDGPVRNRQAQTRAAGLAVASVIQPIKGLKYLLQRFVWNARAGIKHADHNFFAIRGLPPLQPHLHRRAFSSLARVVPHHSL